VNYALLRIVPPGGMAIDIHSQPYVIINPRGGHGFGTGGFNDDSQVGVALRAGHPVYLVMVFLRARGGPALAPCLQRRATVREASARTASGASKPAIVGNCVGSWVAMILAAASLGNTGPVVVVGGLMSYRGGAWRDGADDNPMRYTGELGFGRGRAVARFSVPTFMPKLHS
jgi:hypothetical protein